MAKKLTTTQVRKLTKQLSSAMRKLTIDKMDYGSESNVKMSMDRLVKFAAGVNTTAILRSRR
jgi:hypothetical protein